jgi:DNA-binding transcriptional ArsR family regulator
LTVAARFDALIHAPTRLSIVALLGASDWAEFRFVRDALGLSDSVLSKQLTILENAGYVDVRKGFVGKRPRTWARLSSAGRTAFEGHVKRLNEIVSQGGIGLVDPDLATQGPHPDEATEAQRSSRRAATAST